MREYGAMEDGALSFDDILMVPQHSNVKSRQNVDLRMQFGQNDYLELPVISAPMDTVTEYRMAREMALSGGLGIIHRYMSIDRQMEQVALAGYGDLAIGAAVGATGDFFERAQGLMSAGASVILVDTANGHSTYAMQAVAKLRAELNDNVHLMAGNVSTYAGWRDLGEAGADSVRVGIGGGSCCTTRLVSGHGIPTLASLMEIGEVKRTRRDQGRSYARIIADGGIRTTGDMIKAFAAGADAVMLGSMLAGTDETPGELISDGTGKHQYRKHFRGMASKGAQISRCGTSGAVEGIETTVEYRGPVADTISQIRTGLGSGCSYTGVSKLSELSDNAFYVRVSERAMGESRPHAI